MQQTSIGQASLSQDALEKQLSSFPDYRSQPDAPAVQYATLAQTLWGGRCAPVMSAPGTTGRYAKAALSCPPTACTGFSDMAAQATSRPYRNPGAIENILCLEGALKVFVGANLDESIELGPFDMVSIPANVKHRLAAGNAPTRLIIVLSTDEALDYDAVFDASDLRDTDEPACQALRVRFDAAAGADASAATLAERITRSATLVPYKKSLSNTTGIPPEATEMLSANSVFPLIVPTGHVGRSQTFPIYGNQGLYISIAECIGGDDGPPPHAHSDTQENFLVLSGEWDIATGFNRESKVVAKPYDIVAMPNKVMRSFRNRGNQPARLFVIIQGPNKMSDTVSFSSRLGDEVAQRFGPETIEAYKKIHMTFDAEERLAAHD